MSEALSTSSSLAQVTRENYHARQEERHCIARVRETKEAATMVLDDINRVKLPSITWWRGLKKAGVRVQAEPAMDSPDLRKIPHMVAERVVRFEYVDDLNGDFGDPGLT